MRYNDAVRLYSDARKAMQAGDVGCGNGMKGENRKYGAATAQHTSGMFP